MLLFVAAAVVPPSRAHQMLDAFIQHRLTVEPHGPHLDVIVELIFFEEPSLAERRKMDSNHDGRISRAESESYARDLEKAAATAVRLLVAGSEIPMAPLYPPKVDLLATPEAVAAHHQVRLHFFGSVSNLPPAGADIVVEDRLWPSAPALVSLSDSIDHRIQWEGSGLQQQLKPATTNEVRRFKAHWVGDQPQRKVSP